ncbi:hypothetical protein GQX74_015381 [Glossina fuscipes]|nr:hypothetical protein GQX74_015381 [Glossina fuscipes]
MEKSGHKKSKVLNYESSISTTGTTTASPPYSDNIGNLKYANANFIDNSESSVQSKVALLDFQKIQNLNFEQQSTHLKPPPSKILPSTLPLIDKKSETIARASDCQLREKSLLDMGFKPNEVEGWENIVQPPKDNLYKLLKNMIDNHIKPNVQIRIGGVTFNCHMMVLQCYSDFFMDCNNEVLIQLPEEKITPTAFVMVYDWMLAEEPLVQREGILELFNAANFLRIKELINQCWLCLDDDARFREDTAFLLYLEARKYCLESLEQLMLMRICKFFLTLVASKEFLILSANEVCALLSSNTIGVNSETEIFMSVVRWLSHNWEERKCHMLDLIRCVRFSLMPPWFLVTLMKNPECPEIEHIVNHAEVRNMINDGITYTTTQFYYGEKREDFLQFLQRFQLLTPMQRQWVFDKECNYHHRLECPNLQCVTYKSFLDYLEMILTIGKDYWRNLEMAKGIEKNMQCCVPSDCRKPADPNLIEYLRRDSRDQGIQCENASAKYCNKYLKGANKMQNRIGGSVSTCRRTPRANPRCTPTITTYTKSETDYALQDGENDAYNGNNQDAIKNHVAQQPIMLECINANDCCSKPQPQPHRYFHRLSKSRQSKQILKNEDIKTVIFKTNETNTNKNLGGGDCCAGSGNCLHVDAATKQHVLHDNHDNEEVKLHMRSLHNCNEDGKQNDTDNDCDDDGDYRTKIDGKTNAAMPVNKTKEFYEMRQQLFKSVQMTDSWQKYTRIDYKIIVIGGIDPYCSHCLRENQPQPQKQQGSRMVSVEHSKNSINNANVNSKDTWFPNCGDQVLIYDTSVLEWRHLSYIPLGSRHHHSAILCRGLIYVIGGTKTALGCTKKSTFEKSIWCFDPTTLKWVFESSLPESRRDFAVIAINEPTICSHCQDSKDMRRHDIGFFIIGGESTNGVALNSVWFYSVRRKIWIKVSERKKHINSNMRVRLQIICNIFLFRRSNVIR